MWRKTVCMEWYLQSLRFLRPCCYSGLRYYNIFHVPLYISFVCFIQQRACHSSLSFVLRYCKVCDFDLSIRFCVRLNRIFHSLTVSHLGLITFTFGLYYHADVLVAQPPRPCSLPSHGILASSLHGSAGRRTCRPYHQCRTSFKSSSSDSWRQWLWIFNDIQWHPKVYLQ